MIEGIKNIVELFLDKSKHWTLRAGVFISVIGVLFILDFTLDLSYNYYVSRKLENLEKIQILKKDYSADAVKLKKILFLEDKIINKKHYSEFIFPDLSFTDFAFSSLKKSTVSKTTDQKPTKIVTPKIKTNKPNIRSYFLMLLSSNFLFLIVYIIFIFSPFFDKELKSLKSLSSWFASLIIFTCVIFITTGLSFKIPLINNEPFYNYGLNFILHILLIACIIKIFGKDGKLTLY